jgi:hypothetical protein
LASTKVSCIWRSTDSAREYRTGVSLHSHTRHSKEKLEFIPDFTKQWPILQRWLDRQYRRSVVPIEFSKAYWTSPLTPKLAYEVEKKQIEDVLDLAAMVSLTDHDSIQAPSLLRMASETAEVPLSMEWTIPYDGSVFHLGIHNLPVGQAHDLTQALDRYTQNPSTPEVRDLLAELHSFPEVLIVFNHPLWDLAGLGSQHHAVSLDKFLQQNVAFLHAFEMNGMRKWDENKRVAPLADRWGLPIVSGGDRHASEPSAIVNLSRAQSFAEFVDEIRKQQRSHLLFMQQYTDPMCVRVARAVLDVIRYYPEYPEGSRGWDDRVFHPGKDGEEIVPLSTFWESPPQFVERIFSVLRLAENTTVQWAAKRVYADEMDLHALSDGRSEAIS